MKGGTWNTCACLRVCMLIAVCSAFGQPPGIGVYASTLATGAMMTAKQLSYFSIFKGPAAGALLVHHKACFVKAPNEQKQLVHHA